MRAVLSVVLACKIGFPLLVGAQPAGAEAGASASAVAGPIEPPKKGVTPPAGLAGPISIIASPTSLTSSSTTLVSTSTPSSASANSSTITNTIEVSSFMTSSSTTSFPSQAASTSLAAATGYSGIDSSMSASASPVSDSSDSHRNLTIILSTVLGFVGIFLIAGALFLAYRFGQSRAPFGHWKRGASPINDDEIESWRVTVTEQKNQPPAVNPAMLNRKVDSIALTHSPGWTWTASPTSLRSALSPSTTIPDTPSFLAKAPNSRTGLTDETVPGAAPYIPPIKRQSSRLSKAPPGHGRSKSRRSSMSAKSFRSYNGGVGPNTDSKTNDKLPMWFDPDDHVIGKELSRTQDSSPRTSIFDGASLGGLSPRLKSPLKPCERDNNIGRAIA